MYKREIKIDEWYIKYKLFLFFYNCGEKKRSAQNRKHNLIYLFFSMNHLSFLKSINKIISKVVFSKIEALLNITSKNISQIICNFCILTNSPKRVEKLNHTFIFITWKKREFFLTQKRRYSVLVCLLKFHSIKGLKKMFALIVHC